MIANCTGCLKPVRFEHSGSWARTCMHCGTLVGRTISALGANVQRIPMLEDLTPYRIGDVGSWKGNEFRIVGRVRVESHYGHRNFWSLKGGQEYPWMCSAFGNLLLLKPYPERMSNRVLRKRKPGGMVDLGLLGKYALEMMDKTPRYAFEGELMEVFPMDWELEVEAGNSVNEKVLLLVDRSGNMYPLSGRAIEHEELALSSDIGLRR